ncbi:unnamed protein product [Cyclocybe aegerita]|uniref:Uncharacterized protein n=1 Tax=Cyclocybe aegerita TaxID=1973307 RepID=A0A8S0WUT2_CYCAE|nr:unnamed protein product [Cyclocybe aegerita]
MDSTLALSPWSPLDTPISFRWQFTTSDARSEPIPPPRAPRIAQRLPSPPPPTSSSAVQISQGVWEENDDIYYTSSYPPAQEYLALARKSDRRPPPPSDLVYALAALQVIRTPSDRAHWMFWGNGAYHETASAVSRIALHTPRLIKSDVPWIGGSEFKSILANIQEKYTYVAIYKEWYPTDTYRPETNAKKRALRSSDNGRPAMTVNEFFNIQEEDLKTRKSKKRPPSDAQTTSPAPKRARRAAAPKVSAPKPLELEPEADDPAHSSTDEPVQDSVPQGPRTSKRHKVAPSRAPRTISESYVAQPHHADTQPATGSASPPSASSSDSEPPLSPPTPLSSLHSRNRSTSSSTETLVDDAEGTGKTRSSSVLSADTVVSSSCPPSSKKRKAEDALDVVGTQSPEEEPEPSVRMITRGRASKLTQLESASTSEKSAPPSRTGTPALAESRAKPSRTRTRPKRARV